MNLDHAIIDPRDWGVRFDGTTDDTDAWTRLVAHLFDLAPASNIAPNGGIEVRCPAGVSLNGVEHTLPQRVTVSGQGHGTQLTATSDNQGFFNITGRYQHFRDLHFVAAPGSGAICVQLFRHARGSILDCVFTQPAGNRAAILHRDGNGVFSCRYHGLIFHHNNANSHPHPGAGDGITVPTFDFQDGGAQFNANHLSAFHFFTSGNSADVAPAFRLGSDQVRVHNNTLDTFVGEFCTGGLIHLEAASSTVIINASLHDTAGMTINDHVIMLGSSGDGTWGSRQNQIIGYDRRDGVLAPGIADVWCADNAIETTIMGLPERPNKGYRFDFNNTTGTVIGLPDDPGGSADIVMERAGNVVFLGGGTLQRYDTSGVLRRLEQPTGAGPATWV